MGGMLAFDTLAFAKRLRSSGYTDQQAEALAEAQKEVFQHMLESSLTTKDDLGDARNELKAEIAAVRNELKAEIAAARNELKAEIDSVRSGLAELRHEIRLEVQRLDAKIDATISGAAKDLKIWFGSMLVIAVTIVTALVKLL